MGKCQIWKTLDKNQPKTEVIGAKLLIIKF